MNGKKIIRVSKANPTPRELSRRSHGRVFRSAHIGNLAVYNIAGTLGRIASKGGRLHTTGITLQLYDRTSPAADKNYHPGRIIFNGKDVSFFENSERLTPFMFLSGDQRKAAAEFLGVSVKQIPENLATLHVRIMQRIARGARVYTFSQYLAEKERRVKSVLDHLIQKGHWEIFDRYVDREGNIHRLAKENEDELVYGTGIRVKKSDGVMQALKANRELAKIVSTGKRPNEDIGLLVSVKAVTLLSVVLEAYGKRKSQQVFHASGPDMVNYVLSEAYLKEFGKLAEAMEDFPHLPLVSEFKVFPLLPLRIMAPKSNAEQTRLTNRLAALLQRKRRIERAKYALKYATPEQKKALLARTGPLEKTINAQLEETGKALAPHLLPQDSTVKDNYFQRRWMYDQWHNPKEYELPLGLAVRTIGELDSILNQIKKSRK
ncbi:MAG: hypothetical protein HY393_02455 [Candidatus Diapherotrites archaeon]|nr:hypothetical protein [Candidatus Diapherotrites archaeon]